MSLLALVPEPIDLPYLVTESRSRHILFRVHTCHSASPLVWTGSLSSSGFASPDTHLASVTPASFEPIIENLTSTLLPSSSGGHGTLIPGPYLRHTIVDHILGKWRQTCIPQLHTIEERSEGLWEDEKSPWISGSEDLMWCLWEMARRLCVISGSGSGSGRDEEKVELAVLRHPEWDVEGEMRSELKKRQEGKNTGNRKSRDDVSCSEPDELEGGSEDKDQNDQGGTSTNERNNKKDDTVTPRHRRRPRQLWLRPAYFLTPSTRPYDMSNSLKDHYETSQKAAKACGEVLFYGRVWAENMVANLEWTRKSTPFPLPPHFFRSDEPERSHHSDDRSHRHRHHHHPRHSQSWLDKLVWDPREDDYPTAVAKVLARRRELAREDGLAEIDHPRQPL
ncbi:hypothetical protein CI109_101531 [Kwoniella shandongensis]|uniref:Uncharacterized protein n=1 Tax=Kwoniella shandongensis TaxID=1734106 RepID=A0AAJ8LHX7_9TREE